MTNTITQKPISFTKGYEYKGENAKTLQAAAAEKKYTSPQWATMNQWNKAGLSVAKGENGTPIKMRRKLDTESGEIVEDEFFVQLVNRNQLQRAQ